EDGFFIPLASPDSGDDAAGRRDRADGVIASAVATLPPSAAGSARIFELALRATRDLLRGAGTDAAPTGWFLALPEEDAVTGAWGLARSLGPALLDRLGD